MADRPDLPESVQNWMARCNAEKAKMEAANSVEAIAAMAGLPKWKVFKVVSLELEEIVHATMGKSKKNEHLQWVISESISYARELTREDGFKGVWAPRRLSDLKTFIKDYFDGLKK
jgi:hypothetical protein